LLRSICSLKMFKILRNLVMSSKSLTPLILAGTTLSTQMVVEKEEKVLMTLAVRQFLQTALLNQTFKSLRLKPAHRSIPKPLFLLKRELFTRM
jgi:hypothetical protein